MKKLLQPLDNYRWNLDGIEFAIEERVGEPDLFIGRVRELEYLYGWANRVEQKFSKSIAFLGRRKVGKSLILERLYNILYSEQRGLIPFYYEFTEGERTAKEFYQDFVVRFYLQVIGYYTRQIPLIRTAVSTNTTVNIDMVAQAMPTLPQPMKPVFDDMLGNYWRIMERDRPLYEYVIAGVAAPRGFATTVGVEDKVVQIIDEFQYLNKYIDAGAEDKPCKAYMSTAEMKVAPLIITGSWMGIVSEELMRWLPHRFSEIPVPKMDAAEAQAMTLNYGRLYGLPITSEIAAYIVYVTNGVPGRITELLLPKIGKPDISSIEAVDQALEFEVDMHGGIRKDWDEYLGMAMDELNDVNMRRITYFLCKNEGNWYYPSKLKEAMGLDIDDRQLRAELELLFKYDIVDVQGGKYGGVFDRTLKKVLMKNYGDILNLPDREFEAYFKNDNMLDYLKERTDRLADLALSRAEARELRGKLKTLRGQHNNLKGHYFERELLLRMIKRIIDQDGGIVDGIPVTDFDPALNYRLQTGEELDIVLASRNVVIMAECKNYADENIDQLTTEMVDKFEDKAKRLHQAEFADRELRLGFFSKHGVENDLAEYLQGKKIAQIEDIR